MIQIGTLSVDFEQRDIRCHGASLRIGARALDILEVLHRANGSVVSKDDIMDAVWPGLIVEENRLQVHVATLRKALGANRDLIKTVPGRGYLLIANPAVAHEAPPRATALPQDAVVAAQGSVSPAPLPSASFASNKIARRLALRPAGTRFSPEFSLPWAMGFLALGACIAPWPRHGWLWFEVIVAVLALLASYDALALWRTRQEGTPILLCPDKGLRGREGQHIQVPLALMGSGRRRPSRRRTDR